MTHSARPAQQAGPDRDGTDLGTPGMSQWARRSWWWVLTFGVLTLLAGIAVLAWPGPTLVLIALIIGIQLVVAGAFQFVRAFTSRGMEGGTRALLGVLAVLSFLAGIVLLRHPFATLGVLALILGLFWIVSGVSEAFHGIAERHLPGRGLVIAVGALSVLAGLMVLVFPFTGLVALTWLFGAWLVVYGVMEIGASFAVRRAGGPAPAVGPAPAS